MASEVTPTANHDTGSDQICRAAYWAVPAHTTALITAASITLRPAVADTMPNVIPNTMIVGTSSAAARAPANAPATVNGAVCV